MLIIPYSHDYWVGVHLRFRAYGLGCRVQVLGLGTYRGLGHRVWDLG